MDTRVPQGELSDRLTGSGSQMDTANPAGELAIISSNVNLYYFTGTMQDGILLVPRDGEAVLWVRRSYARAVDESAFPQIRPMQSYRAAASHGHDPRDRIPGDRARDARHVQPDPEIFPVPRSAIGRWRDGRYPVGEEPVRAGTDGAGGEIHCRGPRGPCPRGSSGRA